MKRFSEFSEEEEVLDGDKEKIDSILNKEIVVTGFRVRNSKFSKNKSGKYLNLQFKIDGKTFILFTGSDILIEQIMKYENEIPFITEIKKINRYYTFA